MSTTTFRAQLCSVVASVSASPRRFSSTVMVGLLVLAAVAGPATSARADGITWTARTAGVEDNSWHSVAYGDGLWVAVAGTGTNLVMTSPDGETWTPRASPVGEWKSVAYGVVTATGKSLWVAVARSGTHQVMTSTNGIVWTARTDGVAANQWTSVAYGEDRDGDGLWVAVAGTGTNLVMTSPDGETWTPRTPPVGEWKSVAYGKDGDGDGLWVAVAGSGTKRVMTSTNGTAWTAPVALAAEASEWGSVAYGKDSDGDGLWVAVAYWLNEGGTHYVMTSPDGGTWAAQTAAEASGWFSVAYGDGLWVAVSRSDIGGGRSG